MHLGRNQVKSAASLHPCWIFFLAQNDSGALKIVRLAEPFLPNELLNAKLDPADPSSPSEFPKIKSRNAHGNSKKNVNSGSPARIQPQWPQIDPQTNPHMDQEPLHGAQSCRDTMDRVWQRRSKHGRLRRECLR
jgi:hypothetical protein